MLARDWYYNERRRIGLDTAVVSLCDPDGNSDLRARAARSEEHTSELQSLV